jgi:CheY-like chemotaxis protein
MIKSDPILLPKLQSPSISILLIEDEPNDVIILHHLLEHSGLQFSVLHQRDGADAIDYLKALRDVSNDFRPQLPDVIFLDLKMPRVSGHEVLHWLREQSKFQEIPVLVLTGSDLPQDRDLCARNGANQVLCKHGDPDKLRAQLIQFLRTFCIAQFPLRRSG